MALSATGITSALLLPRASKVPKSKVGLSFSPRLQKICKSQGRPWTQDLMIQVPDFVCCNPTKVSSLMSQWMCPMPQWFQATNGPQCHWNHAYDHWWRPCHQIPRPVALSSPSPKATAICKSQGGPVNPKTYDPDSKCPQLSAQIHSDLHFPHGHRHPILQRASINPQGPKAIRAHVPNALSRSYHFELT